MPVNILTHLRSLVAFLKKYLIELNFFYSGVQDEQTIQGERRSTRFYLVLLIVSMIISTFYYTVIPYTEKVLKESPSLNEYLTLRHQSSLQCPCSKIAVAYEKFIEIEPAYHEICRSNFITDDWINHLLSLYEQNRINSTSSDFRRIAVFQFQTIRSLCQLAKEMNEYNIQSFLKKEFIQSQLILPELFQVQINSFVTEFINSISKTFLRTLHFVQNTTAQSLLMTGAPVTNSQPHDEYFADYEEVEFPFNETIYTFLDGSTCTCSSSNATTCIGISTFENEPVDGFQTGCYMLSALFQSTLQILYNQSFLDKLASNSSQQFQKLNSSVSNSTMDMLLSRMFVDHWLNGTYYERYFNMCEPDFCQYSVIQRHDFLYIVTFMIGFYGGLSSALSIIVPFIIMQAWPIICRFFRRRRIRTNQIAVDENIRRPTIRDRLKTLHPLIKRKIIELNIFESVPPSQNENVIRQQRYSTRLFIILLSICLSILVIFTSLTMQTISVTHSEPTLAKFEDLYNRYSLTLDCPCNQTTIKYNQFIHYVEPQYHEICSSEFVSPKWINIKFIKSLLKKFYLRDIRSQFQTHFQLLSTLCHASNHTIEDNLELFYQTEFISQQVLSRQSFEIQIDLILEQFKRTVPKSFQNTLELIQSNQKLNQFILPTTSRFDLVDNPPNTVILRYSHLYSEHPDCLQNGKTICRCLSMSMEQCYKKMRIINGSNNYIIPGMFLSWFPLQSLLMSTLECLYDDLCLFQIKAFIDTTISSTDFTTLNLSSEYNVNDSIEVLANQLFIQSWNNKSSFQSYFDQCHPLKCQYTYESRLVLIYMITTIIGLTGGLTIVLRLLTPLIVKLVPKAWNRMIRRRPGNVVLQVESSSSLSLGFCGHIRYFVKFVWRSLIELNLFPSTPPSQDQKILRRSRYTTQIYLILLMIALIIILIYTSLRRDTVTIVVNSPTVSKYKQLYMQYPITLKCPCTLIAIKYNTFISQITTEYHQICSSTFVSSKWIDRLKHDGNIYVRDHGKTISFDSTLHFMMMSKFCNLSQNMVDSSLSTFYQTDFVTANAISRNDFDVQTKVLIEQFKRTIADEFMQILKLIQTTNHANQLATVFESNWMFTSNMSARQAETAAGAPNDLPVQTQIKTYGTDQCSCAIQPNCSELVSYRHQSSNQSFIQTLSGFRISCLPLDALLQSSLSCLYNQSCVTMMQLFNYHYQPIPVNTLRYSSLKEPNTTIETILNQLFILKWPYNVSFDRYFNECNPQSCQYSYSARHNRIYVITTLIALFGGLIEGLHFIISYMALIVFKLYDYLTKKKKTKNNTVVPHSEQPNVDAINNENNVSDVVPMPTIVTVQLPVDSIDAQCKLGTTKTERTYLICLHVLIIFVIVVASTIWFIGGKNDINKTVLTSTSDTFITTEAITESTTILARTCHMNLKYDVHIYRTGLDPKSLIINDFNGDLILDIAVTNYGNDTISILLGNGNGTFQTQRIFPTGKMTKPWGIATADFNNDKFLDLAVSLSGTNEVAIFYGNATSDLFIRSPNTLTGSLNNILGDIETFDFNNDGRVDLAICSSFVRSSRSSGLMLVYLNTGDDRQFKWDVDVSLLFTCHILVRGDANYFEEQHHKIIFYIVKLLDDTATLTKVVLTEYHVTRFASTNYNIRGLASSMTKGRFNYDQSDDLALIFPETNTLQISLSDKSEDFIQEVYFTAPHPKSVIRINFNNDEIDDLAVLCCNGTVTIFLGTSSGFMDQNYLSFVPNERNSTQCAHSLKVADFNEDGRDDLVFIDAETHSIYVLLDTNDCEEI